MIVNGKQSEEYSHRVTGHAGHHLMDATAKYYKVHLTGKGNNFLSCSLEKISQKISQGRMKIIVKSWRKDVFGHFINEKTKHGKKMTLVMLVDDATKYKKSFLFEKEE